MKKKKYTLVFHSYLGYGGYFIHHQRIFCVPSMLKRYLKKPDVHFVITGWPKISLPDGSSAPYY